jgi:hypothetical protein
MDYNLKNDYLKIYSASHWFVSTLPVTPCHFFMQGVPGHDEFGGYLFTINLPEFAVIPFILNLYI